MGLAKTNQSASMLCIFYLGPESISTCIDLWARQFCTVNIIPKVHSLVKIPYLMRFTRVYVYDIMNQSVHVYDLMNQYQI